MAHLSRKYAAAVLAVLLVVIYLAPPALAADEPLETELQKEMLALINAEREGQGLSPLVFNDELTAVARDHARDMIDRDYFSHWTPDEVSPADRLRRAGIPFKFMGENLAGNTSVSHAHSMLMKSPGHRGNILEERFNEAGIAVIKGGRYGMMMVMMFMD